MSILENNISEELSQQLKAYSNLIPWYSIIGQSCEANKLGIYVTLQILDCLMSAKSYF